MAAHGITARTSRPATWTQCRQRGGDAAVGSLVMVDLGATDALTAAYDSRTPGAVSSPGTQATASGPYATVIPATAGLASGRVGVVMQRAVSDDLLGSYELGEVGDGNVAPVEVEALVLVSAAATSGAVLGITTSGGSSVLAAGVAGGAWATLLEDATTGSGAVLRRVLLASDGVADVTLARTRFSPTGLAAPAGLGWTPPILPVSTPHGWRGNVSARSRRPVVAGDTVYVDVVNGDNASADPTDPATPLKSIEVALERAEATAGDGVLVKVAPGIYAHANAWLNPTYTLSASSPIVVEAWPIRPGRVLSVAGYDQPTWTVNGTHSNCFDATVSAFHAVVDISVAVGDGFLQYSAAASLTACAGSPGSYYLSGATLTVHALGGVVPGDQVLVLRDIISGRHDSLRPLYVEGVTFLGGSYGARLAVTGASAGGQVTLVDCRYLHSKGDGADIDGLADIVLERCVAAFNVLDGFNYHENAAGLQCNVVEVNCRSQWNGYSATPTGINNGSTLHEACKAVRIGGVYLENEGPNVADVNDALAWCVGCETGASYRLADGTTKAGFYFSGDGAWLYACTGRGADYDLTAVPGTPVYVDACSFAVVSGTTTPYVQTVS